MIDLCLLDFYGTERQISKKAADFQTCAHRHPMHAAHQAEPLCPSTQPVIPGRIKAAWIIKLKHSQKASFHF